MLMQSYFVFSFMNLHFRATNRQRSKYQREEKKTMMEIKVLAKKNKHEAAKQRIKDVRMLNRQVKYLRIMTNGFFSTIIPL